MSDIIAAAIACIVGALYLSIPNIGEAPEDDQGSAPRDLENV